MKKVKCPICNKEFINLITHVVRSHGYKSSKAFQEEWPNVAIVSPDFSKKMSRVASDMWENMPEDKYKEVCRKNSENVTKINARLSQEEKSKRGKLAYSKLSDKQKQNLVQASQKGLREWREELGQDGIKNHNKKLSKIHKQRFSEMTESELKVHIERSIGKSPSKLEKKFHKLLKNKFKTTQASKKIGRFEVDNFIPEINTIVEVYGDYWHCRTFKDTDIHPTRKIEVRKIREKDNERVAYLEKKHKVIIVWESDLRKKGAKEIIEQLFHGNPEPSFVGNHIEGAETRAYNLKPECGHDNEAQ